MKVRKERIIINPEYTYDEEKEKYTIESLEKFIKQTFDEMTKTSNLDLGLPIEELEKINNKKENLKECLKECVYGDVNAKQYIKDVKIDLLLKVYGINNENIDQIIPFDEGLKKLTIRDKFDVLLHKYKQNHGFKALDKLISSYKLDKIKKVNDESYYCILPEEIETIYKEEKIELSFIEKIEIVVQRIYANYKGFHCIDEIRDMHIDGVSGGVNGLPEDFMDRGISYNENIPKAYDSVWIFYKGKSIHLRFLSFESYEQLKRVCMNIYKYNYPGQLSKSVGYKVNKMKDGSRVVVMRPDFSETWMFFIRKFDIQQVKLCDLISGENSQEVIELLMYLMKGARTVSITGAQGSGKTTMLLALIDYIYAVYPIRISEMVFELHCRNRFPYRNICTFQETENISGQEGLDLSKKTDGVVTIVGEVASDEVASYMIQVAQVSKFTLFTHHAKKFRDLIMGLRNSLLKTGVFQNELIAEEQVVRILNFDVHIEKDFYGNRYIERITECIPNEDLQNLNRILYKQVDIVKYIDGKHCFVNKITQENLKDMMKEIKKDDIDKFKQFIQKINEKIEVIN